MKHDLLVLVAGISLGGCSGWRATPIGALPGSFDPRDQVQVWTAGHSARLHGVVVRGDTLHGVPFVQPPDCASCVLHFPLRSIDSVRVRESSTRETQHLGQGVMIVTLLGVLILVVVGLSLSGTVPIP